MMTIKVRVLLGAALIVVLIIIVNMLRKRELELKYVLGWLLVGFSNFLGIYSPMNMIFFLGFLFSLLIIFSLTVALSRVTARVRRLAQIIALEELERKKEKKMDDIHLAGEK